MYRLDGMKEDELTLQYNVDELGIFKLSSIHYFVINGFTLELIN